MGTLYKLTAPNGKSYIGISSKTTEVRWEKHKEHARGSRVNGAIYSALRKYGVDNFLVETLVIADDWGYLCELEQKAILAFNTKSPSGYNVTSGGEGAVGRVLTDAQRANISVAQKKRFSRPEEQAKLRANGYVAAAHKYGLGGDAKGYVNPKNPITFSSKLAHSLATRAAMSDPALRKQLSDSAKRRAERPEEKDRLRLLNTGRKHPPRTPEQLDRQLAGIKAAWADPVKKAARVEKNRLAREVKKQRENLPSASGSPGFTTSGVVGGQPRTFPTETGETE